MAGPVHRWGKIHQIFRKDIWQSAYLTDRSLRGRLYAGLRVISITASGLVENKAASRAAALSFSSLLGLGPLVAITMLVAGFVLGQHDPSLVVNRLSELLHTLLPQMSLYEKMDSSSNAGLVELFNGFIAGARSGSAGVFGLLSLILIVLLLFKSIEDTFNEIWGVRMGRSLLMRIVFYWTILTLGAVLFFAAVTLLGAGAFVNVFNQSIVRLPGGHEVLAMLRWMLPAFAFILLVSVLTLFYRMIPNTHVFWRAAFVGALVVAALLMLNNIVAFLYLRRVILMKSLYGSLGILPILMFGLYIFWFFVLVGGQLSYAVQNVHFRSGQAAWHNLAESTRERLTLVVLLTICRRFQECLPAITASQLGAVLKVPTQILNECINRLVDLKFVSPIPPAPGSTSTDLLYQPARPLAHITLQEFKKSFDSYGEDAASDAIEGLDPLAKSYREHAAMFSREEFFTKPLDQLLGEFPFGQSRPPFRILASD